MPGMKRAADVGRSIVAYFTRPIGRRQRLRMRGDRIRRSYQRAAQDPAFIADTLEMDRAFDVAITDGLEPTHAR